MSEFERVVNTFLLPFGSQSTADFRRKTLSLDYRVHTAQDIKDKLDVKGLVLHDAQVVPEDVPMRTWYNNSSNSSKRNKLSSSNSSKIVAAAAATTPQLATGPIIVIASSDLYIETEEWSQNENPLARLLNAGCPIHLAIIAVGRCYWQEGFDAFFDAASVIRQLIDASYDYQRRIEAICCNASRGLNPVIVFNEYSGEPMLPPVLRGDLTRGRIRDEWIDGFRVNMSDREKRLIQQEAQVVKTKVDVLKRCGEAVVRVFGYHQIGSADQPENSSHNMNNHNDQQLHVKAFTAFFVAPGLLMSTRTATYDETSGTFAHAFKFTRRLRAVHGMLTDGLDLHECRPLEGLTEMLIARVRHVGLSLDEARTPAGLVATPWNDFLLLEIPETSIHSSTYLLPELETSNINSSSSSSSPGSVGAAAADTTTISSDGGDGEAASSVGTGSSSDGMTASGTDDQKKENPSHSDSQNNHQNQNKNSNHHHHANPPRAGDQVFAIGFGERPSAEWMDVVLGSRGYAMGEEVTEDVLRRQWWGFECKCASLGSIMPIENSHNASLLPGTRGGPLLRNMRHCHTTGRGRWKADEKKQKGADGEHEHPPSEQQGGNSTNISSSSSSGMRNINSIYDNRVASSTKSVSDSSSSLRNDKDDDADVENDDDDGDSDGDGDDNTNNEDEDEILTYCGINCGQSIELMNQKRDSIIEMTASEVARKDSLKYIVMNQYIPVHHLCLVFIYQAVIAPQIKNHTHAMYLRRFLAPYDIFVSQRILSACHQKMLLDAEDQNAYGMDFYEHGDLRNALMCFREGAKMFSTASIPDLTLHHFELKDALQTNVSAVVVAQMKRKKT